MEKGNAKDGIKLLAIVVICLVAEFVLSNAMLFGLKFGGYRPVELDPSSAIVTDDGKTLRFTGINTSMKDLCIVFGGDLNSLAEIDVSFTDDNYKGEDGFEFNREQFEVCMIPGYENFLSRSSYGDVRTLEIRFDPESEDEIIVDSVIVNKAPALGFNVIRFGIMFLAVLAIYRKAWTVFSPKNEKRIIAAQTVFVCLFLFLAGRSISAGTDVPLLDKYPLEDKFTSDQYEQLFDAFHSGRLDINADIDPDELAKEDDLYDRSTRDPETVDTKLWDRAYYNGKVYSYFGVAPVFALYFPTYVLTGHIPSSVLASSLAAVVAVISMTFLYLEIRRRFFGELPLLSVALGHLALVFGSLVPALSTDTYVYFIAANCGVASLAAFFLFLIKSYYEEKKIRKIIFFVLTGIFAVSIVTSRPSMMFYCFIALIPLYLMFRDKETVMKDKITYFVALAVPVIIGAVLVMLYNLNRFGSILEFGFNYQVTVNKTQSDTMNLGLIPATIYHFFLQLPSIRTTFPYIFLRDQHFGPYPRYIYIADMTSVFTFPLTLMALFFPVVWRDKKNRGFKEYIFAAILVIVPVLAFIDTCKSGIHYRYLADVMLPLLIVAAGVVFGILTRTREQKSMKIYNVFLLVSSVLMIATIVLGFLMMFATENKALMFMPV